MTEKTNVRRLRADDAEAVVTLRREALEREPLAFAASPADDVGLSLDFTRNSLAAEGEQAVFGHFDGAELTGMVGILREAKVKQRHRARAWAMYVSPRSRGKGAGRALLDAVTEHARAWPGVEQLHLSVSSSAGTAARLYERAGFRRWGRERRALRDGGVCVDEDHLVLDLRHDAQDGKTLIVLLTGPVGGGKSTTALALAKCFRARGRTAAVIDLDLVYGMVRQVDGFDEPDAWASARRGAAALADSFFAAGIGVVVVEGEFFTPEALAQLRTALATQPEERFVTLTASYAEVLRRVQGDPMRGASRDPVFLQRLHGEFTRSLPYLERASQILSADVLSPKDLAAEIADMPSGAHPSPGSG